MSPRLELKVLQRRPSGVLEMGGRIWSHPKWKCMRFAQAKLLARINQLFLASIKFSQFENPYSVGSFDSEFF
jgi:hypothetical protein